MGFILDRPSDGETFNTDQIWTEVYDDVQRRVKVTLNGDKKYTTYESKILSPGDNTDGFDVKTTGTMFGTVTQSLNTTIKNNNESLGLIIYLNTDNVNPITIRPNAEWSLEGFPITNIFIDTPVGYTGDVEITIFG